MSLQEFEEALIDWRFDTRDPVESYLKVIDQFKMLSNNKIFFREILLKNLKAPLESEQPENPQLRIIIPANGRYYVRAVFWPPQNDPIVNSTDAEALAYHYAHDHNFSFLTVGYYGPGYKSDYYEYEYGDVVGYENEPVELRHVGLKQLEYKKLMIYRAHIDIHEQYPPESLSITLNLVGQPHLHEFKHQYNLSTDGGFVKKIVNRLPTTTLVAIASAFADDNINEILNDLMCSHPIDMVQKAILESMLENASTRTRKQEILTVACHCKRLVRHQIEQLSTLHNL